MKRLTSDSNPLYRRWLRLSTNSRAIRELGQTLAEGFHVAQAIVEGGWPVTAALVRRGADQDAIERALAALPPRTPRFELAAALYDRICPVEHGVGLTLVIAIQDAAVPTASHEDLVYLDGVQDPANVGALLRTAAAAGVAHVLFGPSTACAWAPKAIRAAMGAHLRIKISEAVEPVSMRAALAGTWIAAVARDAASMWESDIPAHSVGWAFGSEGAGLSQSVLKHCALRVVIPTTNAVESLNVAAAAAVCLFERRRRSLRVG